jgi:hypothetical protein
VNSLSDSTEELLLILEGTAEVTGGDEQGRASAGEIVVGSLPGEVWSIVRPRASCSRELQRQVSRKSDRSKSPQLVTNPCHEHSKSYQLGG